MHKAMLDRFFELSGELFCVASAKGNFLQLNGAWDAMLGYTQAELMDSPLLEFVHEEDRAATQQVMAELASGAGAISNFVNRFVGKDGRACEIAWSAVYDADVDVFIAAGRDITDQRAAESSVEKFFDVSLELLCTAGTDGYFIMLNPQWEAVLGWTREELRSRPFVEFVHPDDREQTMAEAGKLADGSHRTIGFENRYETKSGEWRWLEWSATLDPAQGVLMATARDATERKKHQRELAEATEGIQRANAAKTEFLANMSHELRTPLNSIIGFSNIMLKNAEGNLRARDLQFLGRVRDAGRHLLALINDVLDISKVEAGHVDLDLGPVALDALLADVRQLQETAAHAKGLELRIDVPSQMNAVMADSLRLRQVVVNLVSNAIKFTERGTVTIRVENRPGTRTPGTIAVTDTGIGIPGDKLHSVFQPFQQVDGTTARHYGGTGLGLSICESLCTHMNMRIEVRSEVGKGSEFTVTLAEAQPAAGAGQLAASIEDETVANFEEAANTRVLVIDDDPDARRLLSHLLEELGCTVRLASGAREGLRIARAWAPELITVDLMMPDTTGWEFLRAVKADAALTAIPVAVVSIIAEENRASLVGAFEVVNKPIERADLVRVLQRLNPLPKRALVVEDDPDSRRLLGEMLESEGITVAEAGNGAEGLSALESFVPDVILLDLMMPLMDGGEFLARFRGDRRFSAIPVIVVTAKELMEEERRSLTQNASAILQKGESLRTQLHRALRELRESAPPRAPS